MIMRVKRKRRRVNKYALVVLFLMSVIGVKTINLIKHNNRGNISAVEIKSNYKSLGEQDVLGSNEKNARKVGVILKKLHEESREGKWSIKDSKDNKKISLNLDQASKNQKIMDKKSKKEIIIINKKEKPKNIENVNNKNKKNLQVSNKEFFKNSLFFGDSITESLSFYDFLDENNVMGIIGVSVLKADKELDNIKKRNPKNIFILLGANDLESTITNEDFIRAYKALVKKIKSQIPNANVYIQSILPVEEGLIKQKSQISNNRIKACNKQIKEMTNKEKVHFIDIASLVKDKSLYEPDGIHFKYDFYDSWLTYLKNI